MNPAFLIQDTSWRTIPVDWNGEFNAKLSQASQSPPTLSAPLSTEKAEKYRIANDNALRMLDSRQIDHQGFLPNHVCGMAFWVWADSEEKLINEQAEHQNYAPRDESFALIDNLHFAWRCIFKFNLASLTLVDSSSSPLMRGMAEGQLRETDDWLNKAIEFEPNLEASLDGLPSPTRQVRYAVQQTLGTLPQPRFSFP